RLVDPLLEEATEALSTRGLERAHQIARLDDALLVRLEIIPDAAPEHLVAELRAEQVEHEPALFVEVPIEQVERRVVVLTDDRPAIAPARLGRVPLEITEEAELVLVAAEIFLAPHVLHERREALVEPALGPITARHVIAEPLVRDLVGDEVVV